VAQASRLCMIKVRSAHPTRRAKRPPYNTFHHLRVGQRPMNDCPEKSFVGCVLRTIAPDGGGHGRQPYRTFHNLRVANGSGGTASFVYKRRNWRKSPWSPPSAHICQNLLQEGGGGAYRQRRPIDCGHRHQPHEGVGQPEAVGLLKLGHSGAAGFQAQAPGR
jgi:hypothetical protein